MALSLPEFVPSARGTGRDLNNVPTEPESDILTADSIALQVIQNHADLAEKYAAGDMTVLPALREKALEIAAGRVPPQELENTLVRKLGASI